MRTWMPPSWVSGVGFQFKTNITKQNKTKKSFWLLQLRPRMCSSSHLLCFVVTFISLA